VNSETKVLLETIQRLTEQRRDLLEAIDEHQIVISEGLVNRADTKLWEKARKVKELCKKEHVYG
jgi:16S rRNA C1402 (ribose-2'-O) methylase RsmI